MGHGLRRLVLAALGGRDGVGVGVHVADVGGRGAGRLLELVLLDHLADGRHRLRWVGGRVRRSIMTVAIGGGTTVVGKSQGHCRWYFPTLEVIQFLHTPCFRLDAFLSPIFTS